MKFILFMLIFVAICIVNAQTSILDTLDVLSELDGRMVFNRTFDQIIAYHEGDFYIGDIYDWWIEAIIASYGYLSFLTPDVIVGYNINNITLHYFISMMLSNNMYNTYPQFDFPWGIINPPMLIDHIDYGNSLTWEDIHPIILGIPAILVDSLTGGWQTHDVTNWMLSDIENNRIYSQYRIRLLNDSDWDGMDDFIAIDNHNSSYKPYITVEYMPDSTSVSDDNIIPQIRDVRIYPNPFRQSTTISFELQKQEKIILTVYNAKGQLVRKLAEGFYAKGTHTFEWDAKDSYGNQVKAGLYIYKITSQYSSQTGKCLLIK
ncbi:MAG: T9SS type A sorting domain-containing protein [Candidatus Cloacimonetes bacterium]|nr:T9SS type A sorting domain-containing protein [Candidatus Cloacimonadota bacterium]